MYQRKSNLQNLIIMVLDCASIIISLVLANYMRNGRLFYSDNERMDFGMMLASCLTVFLALNLLERREKCCWSLSRHAPGACAGREGNDGFPI